MNHQDSCIAVRSLPDPMPQGRDAGESDVQKFFQGLETELECQKVPDCGDWVGSSSTVDFGLHVYPFIFQTSSCLFILAIPSQPETSHTLPSGTLSGFIPTAPALSRNLTGSTDPAKGPECGVHASAPWSSCRKDRGKRNFWRGF